MQPGWRNEGKEFLEFSPGRLTGGLQLISTSFCVSNSGSDDWSYNTASHLLVASILVAGQIALMDIPAMYGCPQDCNYGLRFKGYILPRHGFLATHRSSFSQRLVMLFHQLTIQSLISIHATMKLCFQRPCSEGTESLT